MVQNICCELHSIAREQFHAGERQQHRNGNGNFVCCRRTIGEETVGVIAARRVLGFGRRIGLAARIIAGWRSLRMAVALAMRVICCGLAITRHRRTRGMIVLRTPTQQGVQQNAKDRQ